LLDSDWWLGRALATRSATYVGSISYSLYLWHFPVLFVTGFVIADNPAIGIVISVALSFALAALSWRFVEQPAMRLKSRREGRSSAANSSPGRFR
jgi:peptidoglycan/LPS O-acetylase OafA/YrhL